MWASGANDIGDLYVIVGIFNIRNDQILTNFIT